jgi:multidrug efflux pump subunit AcrA (membrane-fusion protein)
MVATVVVRMKDAKPVPVIPLAAVVKSGDGGYGVYTVEKGNGGERVRLQRVTLGAVRGNSVQIASGLSSGQRIVAAGGLQLADGESVRLVP